MRPADDAHETEWAEYYFAHRGDLDGWGDPGLNLGETSETDETETSETEGTFVALPGDPLTLKYRPPNKSQMQSTTVRVPASWLEMSTEDRKKWAQGECERVCPGATDVSLR